ncbi:translation initiation factor IF-2 [Anaerolentibacter hominis]|uniref:translation initiation factor IF-2 n=1 Tax=Anaerolentibacter hominis TaxID=3079009 RepID=UPI0031B88A03
MAKVKIYELAKTLDTPSKDIVGYLNEHGYEVKSHMSSIEDAQIALVLKRFAPRPNGKGGAPEKSRPVQERMTAAPANAARVPEKTVNPAAPAASAQVQDTVRPQRPDGQRPMQNNGARPQRPDSQRPAQNNGARPQQRPDGQRPMQGGARPQQRPDGQRPMQNSGARPQQRPDGQRPMQNSGARPQQRPDGQRPMQNSGARPQQRPDGQRPMQNSGARPQNGQRPMQNSGARPQNGQRPMQNSGARPQNGQRPMQNSGARPQNGQRPMQNNGARPQNSQRPMQNSGARPQQRPDQRGGRPDSIRRDSSMEFKPDAAAGRKAQAQKPRYQKDNRFGNKENTRFREKDIKKKDPNRKGAFIMPKPVEKDPNEEVIKVITIPETLTVKELADKMKMPASNIVKKLLLAGKMYSINQDISFDEAEEIAIEFEYIVEKEEVIDQIEELLKEEEEDEKDMVKRPPVVCVMGHVDHGKTSLLDAIRESNVTSREAGGITQHIGAYVVEINGEKITFLDTPGHEAFTSMRMRGAKSTDIAVLVVAADDGVMPQTVEAISHAKAAGVEIIVAVNKIDKESANIERVKQELVEYELIPEDWGGETVFVPVSAHTKEGIDQLLEMILLSAEMLELKANPDRLARGIVIEAQLDKGRGPVATILVQKGTLRVGDAIAIGAAHGKIRAMMDDKGRRVKEAGPSTPVEILGLNEVPDAGEIFMAVENEKEARTIAEAYITQSKEKLLENTKARLSLDGLFSQIQAGNIKELNLIIKADVQGSVEAVKQSLLKLSNEEVAVRVIHGGVGAINESDVTLASASNAIIIGFNVKPDNMAKEISEREKVDLRLYRVIYNAIEDVESALKGMLEPTFEEKVIGHAEVRQVFKASGLGTIAGSYVLDGKIVRGSKARISRDGVQIFDGPLASLKRFKDDVKEVASGYECGLVFEKFNDIKEEDQVELYMMVEVPR